jgi:hypothetical protein
MKGLSYRISKRRRKGSMYMTNKEQRNEQRNGNSQLQY